MSLSNRTRPTWLTFDCYGTLIQWDEGLLAYVEALLRRKALRNAEPDQFIAVYDRHEHRLEQQRPHQNFKDISAQSLRLTLEELGLAYDDGDAQQLNEHIRRMPPFPEVVETLKWLKEQGFNTSIISNTDDDVIAGNVAQLHGYMDRVITAEQAQAYKPNPQLFTHAWQALGVNKDEVLHICASPHLDLAAARDMGFRCVWIDRGTKRRALPDYQPDRVLNNLAQVKDLIGEWGWAR